MDNIFLFSDESSVFSFMDLDSMRIPPDFSEIVIEAPVYWVLSSIGELCRTVPSDLIDK